jgi:light-regulated signal transduction histidine kinase (bacteriophytochrome)
VLLRQVWFNLLDNALKYTRHRQQAKIRVEGWKRDSESVYSVADNGAGFDMKNSGRLFGMFQRLHSAEEFEGTGVGLALVERIIRRHGGRVEAEGRVEQGASFYFTLPSTALPSMAEDRPASARLRPAGGGPTFQVKVPARD